MLLRGLLPPPAVAAVLLAAPGTSPGTKGLNPGGRTPGCPVPCGPLPVGLLRSKNCPNPNPFKLGRHWGCSGGSSGCSQCWCDWLMVVGVLSHSGSPMPAG
jgi:hypothetical protein